MRQDLVMDKGVEHRGDNADEIDRETREQMVGLDEVVRRPHSSPPEQRWTRRDVMFCWSQREDEEDWFMPMHPTGSKNFKNLAIEAQKVMKRCVSLGLARALPSTGPADNGWPWYPGCTPTPRTLDHRCASR